MRKFSYGFKFKWPVYFETIKRVDRRRLYVAGAVALFLIVFGVTAITSSHNSSTSEELIEVNREDLVDAKLISLDKAILDMQVKLSEMSLYASAADVSKIKNDLASLKSSIPSIDVSDLSRSVSSLSQRIAVLEKQYLEYPRIQSTSVDINGLKVTYITNGGSLPSYNTTDVSSVQMAVRITNLTGHTITSLDVVGTITFSIPQSNFVNGYPVLYDAPGSFSYAYRFTDYQYIRWEVYAYNDDAKTVVSVKNGESINLRPKVDLKSRDYDMLGSLGTAIVNVNSIAYDILSD